MKTITYQMAMSAGLDAGNAAMRKAGRKEWNADDWNMSVNVFDALYQREMIHGLVAP